ncbi:transcriptional regulator, TetR family [Granulicella rosea]|uniref:Transcriptional regulator, TetR family n=1 Tax=Granulicella rosea TaxID=474952 RepID=A0A239DI75_9BACT|nr:TetR/AcrR family transcriptional regulator [Granulicella rosea]SNS31671.1 transcriptional regulator, TetR family [Granulicella rosea]
MHDAGESECRKDALLDPRIRRSRQMLHDALAQLLTQKEFDKISIQEIAEQAGLNRATFYSHYPDKFTLLNCMVGTRFHGLMARRNVQVNDCGGALKAIAMGVCDFLIDMPGVGVAAGGGQVEGSIQMAIVEVVQGILLRGMNRHEPRDPVDAKTLAATIAWAIYGAAYTWVRTEERCTAEHMAEALDRLISPMLHAGASGG